MVRITAILAAAFLLSCASAPTPTAASRRIGANPPAIVEGRVRDLEGRPAAGVGVRGIPHGADIPWAPAATTDCEGKFRLSLAAPGAYSFLLLWNGEAVITADPRDPALVAIPLEPGERRSGIELIFLGEEWRRISAAAPEETPACPAAPSPPR